MIVESLIANREVLYFVKQEGCLACEEARPELDKFSAEHPKVLVLILDANGPFPAKLGLKVKATPTYFFRRGAEGVARAGALKSKELERWIKSLGGTL